MTNIFVSKTFSTFPKATEIFEAINIRTIKLFLQEANLWLIFSSLHFHSANPNHNRMIATKLPAFDYSGNRDPSFTRRQKRPKLRAALGNDINRKNTRLDSKAFAEWTLGHIVVRINPLATADFGTHRPYGTVRIHSRRPLGTAKFFVRHAFLRKYIKIFKILNSITLNQYYLKWTLILSFFHNI